MLRADGGDNTLADTGNDGVLGGAADKAGEVGANGHSGAGLDDDAVLGHGINTAFCATSRWAVNNLGVDGSVDRLDYVFACTLGRQVDGTRLVINQVDVGLPGVNQRLDHLLDVASRQEVRGKVVDGHGNTRLHSVNARVDDASDGNPADLQRDHLKEGHLGPGKVCP